LRLHAFFLFFEYGWSAADFFSPSVGFADGLSRSILVEMDNRVVRLTELVAAGVKARVSLLAKVFFVVLLLLGLLEGVFSSFFLLE
jgi:hypothetical protein